MSIEIYDKAEVIKHNNKYIFLLKHGSKNSYTCPYQYVLDNNFKSKYLRRQARDSSWRVIAIGKEQSKIADTYWNAPTAMIYGQVRFGDKKNIALYLSKIKARTQSDYSEEQWTKIQQIIAYAINSPKYHINLENIPEDKMMKRDIEYCGKMYHMNDNVISYGTKSYWQLDNL